MNLYHFEIRETDFKEVGLSGEGKFLGCGRFFLARGSFRSDIRKVNGGLHIFNPYFDSRA
jgi:hypothetical protein